MAAGSLRIGAPFGIPLRIHYSWWLIFFLVLFSLARSLYPQWYPDVSDTDRWIMAALATVLGFLSLLLHEFGHALAARRLNIPVHSVELFVLGGAARMMGFTHRPRDEFFLAGSGPAVSILCGLLSWAVYGVLRYPLGIASPVVDVAKHVAFFNAVTVAFNLVPAYPLDGGRLLQGMLWHFTRRRSLSAVLPALVSMALAATLIVLGLLAMKQAVADYHTPAFRQEILASLWLILIALFVIVAALKSYRGVRLLERITGLSVTRAIDPGVQPVTASLALASARQVAFGEPDVPAAPILDADGRAVAVLINDGDDEPAPSGTAGEAAEPVPPGLRVAKSTNLFDALMAMARVQSPWLIVEDADGRCLGTVTQRSMQAALRSP